MFPVLLIAPSPAPEEPASPPRGLAGPHLRYEPGLDGVRGAAVAAVLLYHAGFRWMAGGYLGVSTFFTLSGFLITSLLIAEYEAHGSIDLRRFWGRRFRRIMPAAFLTLAGVAVFAPSMADRYQLAELRGDGVASLAWVLNWWFIVKHRGYADVFAAPSLVQHFWSLAIEEQFYVVFPLVVVALFRLGGGARRLLTVVLAILASASVLATVLLSHTDTTTTRLYYGTDTRAAELLAGALLALAITGRAPATGWWRAFGTVLGILGVTVSAIFCSSVPQESARLYGGGLALYALATVVVLAAVVLPGGPVRALFSIAPLRWLGRISYSVYLYHFPLYLWLTPERTGLMEWPLFGLRAVPTLIVAALSYRLIEWPIRSRRLVLGWQRLALPPLAVGVVAFALVVASRPLTHAAPDFAPPPDVDVLSAPKGMLRVLVVGDSVAERIGLGLERWAHADGYAKVVTFAGVGCGIADPRFVTGRDAQVRIAGCDKWKASWGDAVARFRPNVVAIYTGGWDLLDRELPRSGGLRHIGDAEYDRWLNAEYGAAVDTLSSLGAQIVWLTSLCVRTPDIGPVGVFDPTRIQKLNETIIAPLAAARSERITMVDLFRHVCPRGRFSDELDGVTNARPDGVHFSDDAADTLARWLGPQLIREARRAHVSDG